MPDSDQERRLLDAALSLSGELQLERVMDHLGPLLTGLPGCTAGGFAIRHTEREVFQSLLVRSSEAGGPFEVETGFAEAFESGFHESRETVQAVAAGRSKVARWLGDAGAAYAVGVPLRIRDESIGFLLAGFEAEPTAAGRAFLVKVAALVTPIIWNCFTSERFERGDERRDALIEMSRGINASLELAKVLELSQRVVGGLAGHCASWIDLLDDGGRSFRRYRSGTGAGDEPEEHSMGSTAMAWVLENGKTWQSGDLEASTAFEGDVELRRTGVRQYVATPMHAGGKIIGAFYFGSDDSRPPQHVDIWLYENIALQLGLAIDNAIKHEQLRALTERKTRENVYLRQEIQSEHNAGEMVGRSEPMRRVYAQIARVAATDATVLISGPTGVGKELVARAIHESSARAGQPMVKLNCAAIPENLVESELFGHEKGSFTSAVERHTGRFELAQDGTLFLDEVGELPPSVQAKLLRVLQDGDFERVGGRKTLRSNARIIAATNRDLSGEIESGEFRADLYYRLNVFPIAVPPLAERRDDIPLLVEAFVERLSRRMGKPFDSIDAESLDWLCSRDWPGNVRELQHVIERAVILADGNVLEIETDSVGIGSLSETHSSSESFTPVTLDAMVADHIRRALEQTDGVIEGPRGAAALLGVKPSTLRFRMKRFGIARPS